MHSKKEPGVNENSQSRFAPNKKTNNTAHGTHTTLRSAICELQIGMAERSVKEWVEMGVDECGCGSTIEVAISRLDDQQKPIEDPNGEEK